MYFHLLIQFFDDDEAFEETLLNMANRFGMIDFKGFGGVYSLIFEEEEKARMLQGEVEELAKFAEKENFYSQVFPYKGKVNYKK